MNSYSLLFLFLVACGGEPAPTEAPPAPVEGQGVPGAPVEGQPPPVPEGASGFNVGSVPDAGEIVLNDGSKVVIQGGNVTVMDARGQTVSESACGDNGYNFKNTVGFLYDFQSRVSTKDAARAAELVGFPLKVNMGESVKTIASREEFVKEFATIFSDATIEKIQKAEPRALFCKSEGAMMGDGVVWVHSDGKELKVSAINP